MRRLRRPGSDTGPNKGSRLRRLLGTGVCLIVACQPSASDELVADETPALTEAGSESPVIEGSADEGGLPEDEPAEPAEAEPVEPAEPAVRQPPEGFTLTACGDAPEGTACVHGGWFTRGVDEDPHTCEQADQPRDGRSSVQPSAEVWVDSFYIHLTEVTNLAYQTCVRGRDCEAAGPLYRDYDADTQPITGMNWFQAREYCQSQGMRLPTDAEFELASRGPDGDMYPWGDEPADCDRAIIMNDEGRACGVPKRGSSPDTGRIFEVASRPAGRYGLFDMAGNAEEWVNDWWSVDYADCGEECLGGNPMGPCGGADECRGHRYRSIRGGSWYWPGEHAHGAHRRRYEPDNDPPHHFGFRCAVRVADYEPSVAPSSDQ